MEETPSDASNARSNRNTPLRSKRSSYGATTHVPRTAYLVKTATGFGFTLADTECGQMVRLTAGQLGRNQLKSGDVIVAIGDTDVSRETHLNVVSLLKSYPAGSTARISFIRPAEGGKLHLLARSTVPDAECHGGSVYSVSSSSNHRASSRRRRRPTSHNPEAAEGDLVNGARAAPTTEPKTSRTPAVLPRSSSLSYSSSSEASRARPVRVEGKTDGFQQRTVDVRAGEEDLRNAIALRRSLPTYEIQRQYWMNLSPSNSSLNFSGTPDYIPASVYSLSPTSGGDMHRLLSSSSSIEGVRPSKEDASAIADKLNDLNFETDSTLTEYSRLSEAGGHRTNSLSSESTARSARKKLFQRGFGSKRQPMKVGSTERRSSRNHRTSSVTRKEHSAEVDQAVVSADDRTLVFGKIDHNEGTLSPVDRQSPVYCLEIHRGSRGFGFSIRGGKEFRGMPLLVLNIAKGGPADMDGRMKNGDQILSINGFETKDMTHKRAIELIQSATSPISLTMKRPTDVSAR